VGGSGQDGRSEDQDGWSEGHDAGRPSYRERLRPSLVIVVLVLGLAGIVGVAYGAAYGSVWGWAAGLTLGAIGIALLGATSTPLHVDDRVFRAGRARLPLSAIAGVRPLDAESMRQARRHGDPRDYVVLRAWATRVGVAVDVDDTRDPHPRWIVSSRRPEALAAAIEAARGTRGATAEGSE